jgi:hypothetical protein
MRCTICGRDVHGEALFHVRGSPTLHDAPPPSADPIDPVNGPGVRVIGVVGAVTEVACVDCQKP